MAQQIKEKGYSPLHIIQGMPTLRDATSSPQYFTSEILVRQTLNLRLKYS